MIVVDSSVWIDFFNGVSTPVEVGTFPSTSAVAKSLGGKALQPVRANDVIMAQMLYCHDNTAVP